MGVRIPEGTRGQMIFPSASRRGESTQAFARASALLMFFSSGLSAGAQAAGPPPPFKPMASVRFGDAYSGPRELPHRTILGLVKDEDGKVVPGAMVHMRDIQAKSTLVAFVDDNGTFRFGSLSLRHDYEIWAEAGERKSPTRSVTTFMTQNEVSMPLQVRAERNHDTPALKRRPNLAGDTAVVPTAAGQRPASSVPAPQ